MYHNIKTNDMAYLTTEKTKEYRKAIRKEFPTKDGWKISVRNEHLSGVMITIEKAPVKFTEKEYEQLNTHFLERYENSEYLLKMKALCSEGNYNNSDIMTDYFDIGWYVWIHVGRWDIPFELSTPKTSK